MKFVEFITQNWLGLSATIGTAIAWFFDRRRRRAETQTAQGSAMETMQRTYDQFVSDAKIQYDALMQRIKDLEEREREAYKERAVMLNNMERDKKHIVELERKVEAYEKTIEELRQEVAKYTANKP